jgi:hypothetical protein
VRVQVEGLPNPKLIQHLFEVYYRGGFNQNESLLVSSHWREEGQRLSKE